MAENKKSFILYVDSIDIFEQLTDDQAGKLAKHIFRYVNDLDPISDDAIVNIAFTPIKQYLKRDLTKWNETSIQRSDIGRLGGLKSGEARRKQKEANEANGSKLKQIEHDSVSDSDSDSEKEYNQFYQTEIKNSNNDELYLKFVDHIFGNNELKRKFSKLLKMKDQLTYEQFLKLIAKINKHNELNKEKKIYLSKMIESYENGKYKNESIYLTINNWINNNNSK
jgi:hypothetical protein